MKYEAQFEEALNETGVELYAEYFSRKLVVSSIYSTNLVFPIERNTEQRSSYCFFSVFEVRTVVVRDAWLCYRLTNLRTSFNTQHEVLGST